MIYTGQQQIRIIRKDRDGCFLSTVVAYGGNANLDDHQRQCSRSRTGGRAPLSVIWWL